ncbi:hypothetical protein AB0D67_35485 [Streptosporangium sp. NPDC048047]|uniref:hypothetical protein n=1 Tax=unclassified Streptosporangium TaxID=2632669 RepID=UPI003447B41C
MAEHSMPHDFASWSCPHGQDARQGCAACYAESATPGAGPPVWEVVAWFTTEQPLPIRTLQDVHHHGRQFSIDQPSTPLVYLLTGRTSARDSVQAVASVLGFLLHERYTVDGFTATEIRVAPLPAADPGTGRRTDTWISDRGRSR